MLQMDGESCLAALQWFYLLKILSRMERVVTVVGEEGASEVGSCGEAQAPAEVGEVKLVGWSWWMESRGMVSGLSHCLRTGVGLLSVQSFSFSHCLTKPVL